MDITDPDHAALGSRRLTQKTPSVFPSKVVFQDAVNPLLEHLSQDEMRNNLETFTSFHTRYYKSKYGQESSEWLLKKVNDIISESPSKRVTARAFSHPWGQNSIIATIPGKTNATIVLGAHQDSI